MDELARFGSASLAQVAQLTGRDEDDLASDAVKYAGEGAAVRGWLTPAAVTALIKDVKPSRSLQSAEALLLSAFRQARESAKRDWESMTVPVLKNRLLVLTGHRFREAEYGSPNIWHFVTQFPKLLATEGTRPSERVRLQAIELVAAESVAPPAQLDPVGKGRIRVDLWRAVFDYSSGQTFVWDNSTGRARPRTARDATLPVVPTMAEEDLRRLRKEFVETQEAVSEHDAVRLEEWISSAGTTAALPRLFRPLWNAHLKSHAADRLRTFFLDEGFDVPTDLHSRVDSAADVEPDVEEARRLAHRYIDAMTGEELTRLSIELGVVRRVTLHDGLPA